VTPVAYSLLDDLGTHPRWRALLRRREAAPPAPQSVPPAA